jgi:hypothetical protein
MRFLVQQYSKTIDLRNKDKKAKSSSFKIIKGKDGVVHQIQGTSVNGESYLIKENMKKRDNVTGLIDSSHKIYKIKSSNIMNLLKEGKKNKKSVSVPVKKVIKKVDGTKPVKKISSTKPIKKVSSTKPIKKVISIKPVKKVGSTKPVKKAVKKVDSTKPVKKVGSTKPVKKAVKKVDSTKPVKKSVKKVDSTKPVKKAVKKVSVTKPVKKQSNEKYFKKLDNKIKKIKVDKK